MTVLVATDLDRTMIYSATAMALGTAEPDTDTVCVEHLDGAPISFMMRAAADAYAALAAEVTLVPVTTRIARQYERVQLPGPPAPYAIAANGGVIYVDAMIDDGWSRRIATDLSAGVPLAVVWDYVQQVCDPDWTLSLRDADGLFCYAVVDPDALPAGFVDDVTGWAAERGWQTSLQGRKLYWVPDRLTKSAALAEVAARAGADRILAAGDSLLDVDMLLAAHRAIHPRHGELYDQGWSAPGVQCTETSGAQAGLEILRWFVSTAAGTGR